MNKSTLLLNEEAAAQEPSVGVCRNTGIRHVGLYAKDPSVMAEFYRDVLGMQVVGGSSANDPLGATAFPGGGISRDRLFREARASARCVAARLVGESPVSRSVESMGRERGRPLLRCADDPLAAR